MTERIRTSQAAAQHRLELQNAATAAAAAEKKAAAATQRAAQLQAELQVHTSLAITLAYPAARRGAMLQFSRVALRCLWLWRLRLVGTMQFMGLIVDCKAAR